MKSTKAAPAKTKTFKMIRQRLTPSGMWDDGYYQVSNETIEIPVVKLTSGIIVHNIALKGVTSICSRIVIDGQSYLVEGEV